MTDESDEDRDYPLHDAVKNNDLNVLEELLKSGRHDNYLEDAEGQTAMDLAIQLRNCSAVELLLDHGGEPLEEIVLSEKSEKFIEEENDDSDYYDRILIDAVIENKKKAIEALVFWGLSIYGICSDLCSISYYAVRQEDKSLISLLLDLDIEVKWDALQEAIRSKNVDIVNMILEHGYDDDSSFAECPLNYAIRCSDSIEIFKTLLEHGEKYWLTYYNDNDSTHEKTAISQVVSHKSGNTAIQMINLLIQHGYNVNERDRRRETALHKLAWTRCGNKFDLVCYLIYRGVNVKAKNSYGNAPKEQALLRCRENYFRVLLFCQPNTSVSDMSDRFYSPVYNTDGTDYSYEQEVDEDKVEMITYLLDFSNDEKGGMRHLGSEKMLFYHAKRIAAGFPSNPNLENCREEEKLKKYLKSCKDEVDKMKQTKICEDVTYYEVLRANRRRLKVLAEKPEVREALVHEKTKEFPIYAAMLDKNLLTGVFFEPFPESLDDEGEIFQVSGERLPLLILDEIQSYLSRDDLRNWEIAKQGDSAKELYHDTPKAVGSLFCSVLKLL